MAFAVMILSNKPAATAKALHRIEAFPGDEMSMETWLVVGF